MLRQLKVPLALTVAAGAMIYLIASGVSRNDIYMSTLENWDPERARRETVRLMGFVAEGTVSEEPDRLLTTFRLRDEAGGNSIPVHYKGVTPDLFRDGVAVIVSGRLGEDGTMAATDLMTKCPSKYEGAEELPPSATDGDTIDSAGPAGSAGSGARAGF